MVRYKKMKKEYKEQQITLDELNNLKELINKIDEDNKIFSLTQELIKEKEHQITTDTVKIKNLDDKQKNN